MRKISILIMMAISTIADCQALKSDTIIPPISFSLGLYIPGSTTIRGCTSIRIRCGGTPISEAPLLILDGILVDFNEVKDLDPSDIVSIDVLKGNPALSLYGSRGAAGVVLITTKKANQRTILIKDVLDGRPIAGATVEIIARENKDANLLIADSSGTIITNKIVYDKEYELRVSSIGYKPVSVSFNPKQIGKNYRVLLERDFKSLNAVVVLSEPWQKIRCGMSIINIKSQKQIIIKEDIAAFKIYPNPVQRSQSLSIVYNSVKAGNVSLRLLGFDGKLVNMKNYYATEGNNKLSFQADNKIAGGVYIIQLVGEAKRVLKSEKLIIQ